MVADAVAGPAFRKCEDFLWQQMISRTPVRRAGSFPAGSSRRLTGRIKVHPVGYGFVVPNDGSEDVHVSARNRGTAMDGDTVEVEAWEGVRGIEGRVTRVIERGRAKVTGQLTCFGRILRLQPDDPRITGSVV